MKPEKNQETQDLPVTISDAAWETEHPPVEGPNDIPLTTPLVKWGGD